MSTLDLINPFTGEVFGTSPVGRQAEVDTAVQAAADAFVGWRRSTPRQRQTALLAIADALVARADEIADLECRETGKDRAIMRADEIPQSADVFRFFAGAARALPGIPSGEYLTGHTSSVRREPLGVIAQITPWNYPLLMAVWKIAPAVAAGNTVVLKPADTTPSSTVLLGEIASDFLPDGVVNVVTGDRETGRLLVAHPIPAMVSITGSTRAGIEVARSAADTLKRTHLELGGNAPVLVFDDVDIPAAVEGIVGAAFYNAGQDCTAASRVLVQEGVHDKFLSALVDQVSVARTGPLNSSAQLERVTGLLARRPEHTILHCGGNRIEDRGYFLQPAVVSGVRQNDELAQEEIFAPVITVQQFASEPDGVAMANGVPQGLASSVWTSDASRAVRVSAELDFGCVWVNTHGPFATEMPHGGFGQSGYGKDLSMIGLEDYTRVKHVMARFA